MSVGRNEPCPCGSGRKYKQCHEGAKQQTVSRGVALTIGAVAVLAALGVASVVSQKSSDSAHPITTAASAPAAANAPSGTPVADGGPAVTGTPASVAQTPAASQPPGPAPEGKVWSKEHGHWHDAATGTSKASPIQIDSNSGVAALATAPGTSRPQVPVATPPPGKVWSAEHGHWHDAPGAEKSPTAPKPVTGPLSSPNSVRVLGQEISREQPAGPAPAGKVWSPEHGHWHDKQ